MKEVIEHEAQPKKRGRPPKQEITGTPSKININVPAVREPQSMEQQLIALAKDPGVDVQKLQMLIDMNKQLKADQNKEEFAAAFVVMKPHLPKILKKHDNTQTKSKYAKLEDINVEIDPILHEYGFGTATKILESSKDGVRVRAELWHKNGHVESTEIFMPIDDKGPNGTVNKTGPHAISSSTQYAKRVSICALLNISTGDDTDGNRKTIGAELPEEKYFRLMEWVEAAGGEAEAVPPLLKYLKIEGLNQIDTGNYMAAVNFLKQRTPKAK